MMGKATKILITGDTYLGGGRVKEDALNGTKKLLFGSFLERIQSADLAITNLESPLIDDGIPMPKIGPNFKSPTKTLNVLKDAGFGLLTLANNHIMDFGEEGLLKTLETCSNMDMAVVGAGKNIEKASKPYQFATEDFKVGLLNIAENEFGTTHNGLPGAYPLDPISNWHKIMETSKTVDHLIIIMHGGHENYPLPSPKIKKRYRFFIDAGADAVVGHHPHCYSGYEIYKGSPIFYSLGNFLFDNGKSANDSWSKGYMVELSISIKGMEFNTIPYVQNGGETIGLRVFDKEERRQFEESLTELNKIIADDEKLKKQFMRFCESSRDLYNAYIEPYTNKYLHGLRRRKLFPSLLSKKKKRLLLNLIRCESHRDVLTKMLTE